MRTLAISVLAVALTGCLSFPKPPSAQELAARDDATCQSYGAQPGTDIYIKCRMQIAQERQRQRAAIIGAMMQHPLIQPIPAPAPITPKPQTNCTTTYVGGQAYTHCN